MNFPRLYPRYDRTYGIGTLGLGALCDTISCTVTEEKNGVFTLTLTYPVGGALWRMIDLGRVILCKPNPYTAPQPFTIRKISRVMRGKITVNAEHLSCRARGFLVQGFNASTSRQFVDAIEAGLVIDRDPYGTNFLKFDTDIEKTITPYGEEEKKQYDGAQKPPRTLREILLGKTESFLSFFGGEFEFDYEQIFAHEKRGEDRGVTVRYGKNLTALTQVRTSREFTTAVYPYWYQANEEGTTYVELPEKKISFGDEMYSDIFKIEPLDLSSEFKTAPTEAQLREAAKNWIEKNKQEAPPYNLTLSFLDLSKTEEYKNIAEAETVKLCDIITVIYPEMDIAAKLQVTKTTYDVLKDRYVSIEVGNPQDDLADTLLKITGAKR